MDIWAWRLKNETLYTKERLRELRREGGELAELARDELARRAIERAAD